MSTKWIVRTVVPVSLLPFVLSLTVRPPENLRRTSAEPTYQLAFANFGPVNTDIFTAEPDGSNPRPLLPHPALDYNASFSADGRWVIFTSERKGSADIYRVHPDGSGLEQLTNDPAFDDQAALSPNGRTLAFVSTRSGQADVYTLDLETRKLTNLTNHPAGDFRPAWSPDGEQLAFSTDRDSQKPRGGPGGNSFSIVHSTEIYTMRSDGSNIRRITTAGITIGGPVWSRDGTQLLVYEAAIPETWGIVGPQRKGTSQIAEIDLATGQKRVLTTAPGVKTGPRRLPDGRVAYVSRGQQAGVEFIAGQPGARGDFDSPAWSADGRRMLFHREVDTNWPPAYRLFSRDPQFQLMRAGLFPAYSPSGKQLICIDQRLAIDHNSVLLMNADGSGRRTLFQHPTKSVLAPVWSPQGDKIAFGIGGFFQTLRGKAVADIGVINSDGTNLQILTDSSGNYGFPSWSPDGKQIVCRAATDSVRGLFIIDVATRAIRPLTSNSQDNFPAWSPTGDVIAFTSKRDGDYDIYTIRPDGTDLKRLTNAPGNDAHGVWSPDGKWLAFSTSRNGFKDEAMLHALNPQPYGEISVMRADGADLRILTDNQYEEATPAWMIVTGVRPTANR